MESRKPGARTGAAWVLDWVWVLEAEEAGVVGKVPGARGVLELKGSISEFFEGVVVVAVFGRVTAANGVLLAAARMFLTRVARSVRVLRAVVRLVTLKGCVRFEH